MKMTKRMTALVLALVMVCSMLLTGCGHEHAYGEWTEVSAADCVNDGSQQRTCECGEVETQAIPAAGHAFSDWTPVGEATCTTDGQQERVCSVCGEKETQVATAPGHKFLAATYFAPKTCSVCGETEGEPLGTILTVGQEVSGEEFSFVLEDVKYLSEMKYRQGNTTYRYGADGSYFLVLQLNLTNLSTEAIDKFRSERFSDMELVYNHKYDYEGDYWIPVDDIVPLDDGTVYVFFAVPESMEDDTDGNVVATFEFDKELFVVVVNEGSPENAAPTENPAAPSGGSQTPELAIGDTRANEGYEFTLDDIYYAEKVQVKKGNTTYSYSSQGYHLILKLDFTNLDSETLNFHSDRFEDIGLVFNDKFNYEGKSWIPGSDIVPLDDGTVLVFFVVPEAVETESGSLIATFTIDGDTYTVDCRAN